MSWLHRLQQRISITRHEALTLISLSLFLMLGITGRHVCRSAESFGPETYAEVDSLFARQSAAVFEADASMVAVLDSTDSSQRSDLSQNTYSNDETLAPARAETMAASGRIDINRATAAELVQLPRVGPKIAERILAFRTTFGPLQSLDELAGVRGIGPKTLELIRPHAFISADPDTARRKAPDSTK